MKRLFLTSFVFLILTANAQIRELAGFVYGNASRPTGKEWESPEQLGYNKEQPHAWFFCFDNQEDARRVLPEYSHYYQLLDGMWKFHWVGNPSERPASFYQPDYEVSGWDEVKVPMQWNVVGIQKDGSLKYGVPVYANQPVIFQHKVAVGDWKGGVMRTPPQDWITYKNRNEVGSYRRNFTLPEDWKGREVYLNFDGVSSFFYLWVNGKYVGFSKNSRNTASFDITPYLYEEGENMVAVEVYRNSDGSFLEAQDMFRLPGIFRSVSLTATSKVQVRDLRITPDLDADYRNGSLKIEADIRNLTGKEAKDYTLAYSLYANKLYSDENSLVEGVGVTVRIGNLKVGEAVTSEATIEVENPAKWSAEEPYRYVVVGHLKDKKGRSVELFSTAVGFRKVEIKDTPAEEDEFGLAGRYYYVNGKTVKLKGVNRQEICPETGNVITHKQMEEEIMLMKRGNINHVRNSHYSCEPYWYYYCDKYGIYLEDEANLESHEYYYGDASLSHVPEFEAAHVARVMELAHAHVNHPSIVIWSLGNEGGPGKNFAAAYQKLHEFDPSRPIQYERNNRIVDMGSNQYPSIAWMRGAVTGKYNIKYPFHVSEYAHSMGNAVGNLIDYWDAIESTNFFCGAAIWDWVDQALWYYDRQTGDRYLAYGGDFGDKPNSGMFCMNGILFPGHRPKPQFYEVKKVYQNLDVQLVDSVKGEIELFNKNYFTDLNQYELVWTLYKDGKPVYESEPVRKPLAGITPRDRRRYTLNYQYDTLTAGSEYFVKVQLRLAQDMPWAKAGFVQMEEQLQVKAEGEHPSITVLTASQPKPKLTETEAYMVIVGNGFTAKFDNREGTLYSLEYDGKKMICEGQGPKLNALRAPVDNDNWAYPGWFEKGLHNLKHRVIAFKRLQDTDESGNRIQLMYTVESQAPNGAKLKGGTSGRYQVEENTAEPFGPDDFKFVTNQIWTVYPDGTIELRMETLSNDETVFLPRLGYAMQIPSDLSQYSYYGRGPWNNFNDRCTGSFIGLYQSTVKEQFVDFPKPQSMGNREGVHWCALTDKVGNGIEFVSERTMSASALPWSDMELTLAPHPYQLPPSSTTHLHLDLGVTGLGGNSCGQGGPLEEDRVKAESHAMSFLIRPVRQGAFIETAQVSGGDTYPLSISRARDGRVTIHTQKKGAEIVYTLNGSKKQNAYIEPFSLNEGGVVTAFYKDHAEITATATFDEVNIIPLKVVSASSEETGNGDAANLVDGNIHTTWFTMHTTTVAKYPHWVDFDAGKELTITGFTYLPRQDASYTGCVKDYTLSVSMDGKKWTDHVARGAFPRNKKLQTVKLRRPVKARYIRFTALSSQPGTDYGGGAEFSILTE